MRPFALAGMQRPAKAPNLRESEPCRRSSVVEQLIRNQQVGGSNPPVGFHKLDLFVTFLSHLDPDSSL